MFVNVPMPSKFAIAAGARLRQPELAAPPAPRLLVPPAPAVRQLEPGDDTWAADFESQDG